MGQHEEEMLKYMGTKPTGFGLTIGCIVLAIASAILDQVVFLIISFGLAVLSVVYTLRLNKYKNQYLKEKRESGEMGIMVRDYANAEEMAGGNVLMGNEYIFGKGKLYPVRYEQITRIYQQIHKTNGAEDGRYIIGVFENGNEGQLCDLELKGKSDEDVVRIFTHVRNRNPDVIIGTK